MPNQLVNGRRPIGVFDSGVGGLTVLSALGRRLPSEDLVYLGDTARVPYGTRSPATVVAYARLVAGHLWKHRIKALVVACNTASTWALDDLSRAGERSGVPVYGVISPGVHAAAAVSHGAVAVLGTEGTIRGGRYRDALEAMGFRVVQVACPLFVALAEEGWHRGDVARAVAHRYLDPLAGMVDTAILGCTHYPLLVPAIRSALPGVRLVASAAATAEEVAGDLDRRGLLAPAGRRGSRRFLVTDDPERFRRVGRHFLDASPEPVELVDLDPTPDPFSEPA